MGGSISSLFGVTGEEQPSQDYLQLTDLGGFLAKYIFIMLDKDKTKRVPKHEYLTLVNHFREKKTDEQELDEFLSRYVEDGETVEYIDEMLFKKLIIQLAIDFDQNVSDRMKYLMTLFDKDHDGFVSEADLRGVYDAIGIQVPIEPIHCLIEKYDKDKDGKLSMEEFEHLGRSAMSKLFVRREKIEDILVEEALLKGGAALMTPSTFDGAPGGGEGNSLLTATKSLQSHINEVEKRRRGIQRDYNNNIETPQLGTGGGMAVDVDDTRFGSPVELRDSSTMSTLYSVGSDEDTPRGKRIPVSIGNSGDSMASLERLLHELEMEDVED